MERGFLSQAGYPDPGSVPGLAWGSRTRRDLSNMPSSSRLPGEGVAPDALLFPAQCRALGQAPTGVEGLWDSGAPPTLSGRLGATSSQGQEASAVPGSCLFH